MRQRIERFFNYFFICYINLAQCGKDEINLHELDRAHKFLRRLMTSQSALGVMSLKCFLRRTPVWLMQKLPKSTQGTTEN